MSWQQWVQSLSFLSDQDQSTLIKAKGPSFDSRQVELNSAFFAFPSPKRLEFIQEAIQKGASCLVTDKNSLIEGSPIPVVYVDHSRWFLSSWARHLYPHQPALCAAVTGTNGKTSVVHFLYSLWKELNLKAASLGTLGLQGAVLKDPLPSLTTFGPLDFYKILSDLKEAQISHFSFEASSHGLDQSRLAHIDLNAAGFTNLSQDHLDYHGDMESYFKAKLRLFSEVLSLQGTAVLPKHSHYFGRLFDAVQKRGISAITFSTDRNISADLKLHSYGENQIQIEAFGKLLEPIPFHIEGTFQIENLLCALGLALVCGNTIEEIYPLIPHLKAACGRLELVRTLSNGAKVYVDYAHTPDALEKALKSLRPLTQNQLWVVFGCGGNRDALKRPIMGKTAKDYANQIIVTNDNPRFEDPTEIRKAILEGCPKAQEIPDRREAIAYALENLKEGDVLLIAGKGHEEGQSIQGVIHPFKDHEEVYKFENLTIY